MKKKSRRKFIMGVLSSLGIIGFGTWLSKNSILQWVMRKDNQRLIDLTASPTEMDDICILTTKVTEGPFYIKSPKRSDIRESKKGKNLDLKLQFLSYPNCTPIEGAIVEIWHCDANGTYSGYPDVGHNMWEFAKLTEFGEKEHIEPTNEKVFLRGAQITNKDGNVNFKTILPGWYDPRMPHIHFKAIINSKEEIASELFFEEEFFNKIYTTTEPYVKYGKSPYGHSNDKAIANYPDGNGLVLSPKENGNGTALAFTKIGLKMS
jgi:protocatechuate 3,4-dioxygenase beta subunit